MNAAFLPQAVSSLLHEYLLPATSRSPTDIPLSTARPAEFASASDTSAVPIQEVVDTLNTRLTAWATSLRFEIDTDLSRVIVSVIDRETGETIRQIPSEEAVHLAKELGRLQDLAFKAEA